MWIQVRGWGSFSGGTSTKIAVETFIVKTVFAIDYFLSYLLADIIVPYCTAYTWLWTSPLFISQVYNYTSNLRDELFILVDKSSDKITLKQCNYCGRLTYGYHNVNIGEPCKRYKYNLYFWNSDYINGEITIPPPLCTAPPPFTPAAVVHKGLTNKTIVLKSTLGTTIQNVVQISCTVTIPVKQGLLF